MEIVNGNKIYGKRLIETRALAETRYIWQRILPEHYYEYLIFDELAKCRRKLENNMNNFEGFSDYR